MKIVQVELSKLKAWKRNPRKNDAAAERLAKLITEYGFVNPVVATPDGTIRAGHTRVKAAASLGMKTVPVVYKEFDSEEQAQGYSIADNKSMEWAEWDFPMLEEIIDDLKTADFDLELTGFDVEELDTIFPQEPEPESEDIPEPPKKPVTRPGDLWILGNHRLLCGDCTKKEDVEKLMGGAKADMVVTSPPYFNQREYSKWDTYKNYLEFIKNVIENTSLISNQKSFIVCWNIGSSETTNNFIPADNYHQFFAAGFKWIEWIVWNKESASWTIPRNQHIEKGIYVPALKWESISVYLIGKRPHFDIKDKKIIRDWQENVWAMNKVVGSAQKKSGHPAMFPIELPSRCIMSYSKSDSLVYEPFLGSGSTMMAAEQLGRRCYGLEIAPQYVDVAIIRWMNYTGKQATREDGLKFPLKT